MSNFKINNVDVSAQSKKFYAGEKSFSSAEKWRDLVARIATTDDIASYSTEDKKRIFAAICEKADAASLIGGLGGLFGGLEQARAALLKILDSCRSLDELESVRGTAVFGSGLQGVTVDLQKVLNDETDAMRKKLGATGAQQDGLLNAVKIPADLGASLATASARLSSALQQLQDPNVSAQVKNQIRSQLGTEAELAEAISTLDGYCDAVTYHPDLIDQASELDAITASLTSVQRAWDRSPIARSVEVYTPTTPAPTTAASSGTQTSGMQSPAGTAAAPADDITKKYPKGEDLIRAFESGELTSDMMNEKVMLSLQRAYHKQDELFTLLSDAEKSAHERAMTAIRNIA